MNYLVTGEEEYLKRRFVEKLKKSLLQKEDTLDFEAFRAGDSDISSILDSVSTLPFTAKHRITLIRDIEKFPTREKDTILKCLRRGSRTSTIVLESSSRESDKFLKEISALLKTVPCRTPRGRELEWWIKKEFVSRKKKISQDALKSITEKFASSGLLRLENEINKICAFLGKRNEVTADDLERLLGEAPGKTVFELTDLVLGKRIDKIFSFIDTLLTREKPHQVLNLLAWQFRNLMKLKALPGNFSAGEVSAALGMHPRLARKAMEAARRFTRPELEKKLEVILEADLSMKTGRFEARDALTRALVELCR